MAPFGLDVQHLHFQCHFADGKWDHAQEIADGFPVRVTIIAEAYLSSMALFIDVARGNPAVAERRAWIEPFWSAHGFDEFTARGVLAEHALWRGDTERALADAQAAIAVTVIPSWGYSPSVIRPAAVALSARADRAVLARAAGDDDRRTRGAGRGGGTAHDRPPGGGLPPAAQVHPRSRGHAAG